MEGLALAAELAILVLNEPFPMSDLSFDRLELVQPTESDWDAYFDLRWRVLREPWGQPRGSERGESDSSSYHLMFRGPDGAAVAVGRLHLNTPEEAQVRYMAVDPLWRCRGLGGRILEGLETHALLQAVVEIVLNAREEAIAFYVRHGYRVERTGETLFGSVRHAQMRKRLVTART
jgi:ribosomal protein S18 acetylase RimI-like enzyme